MIICDKCRNPDAKACKAKGSINFGGTPTLSGSFEVDLCRSCYDTLLPFLGPLKPFPTMVEEFKASMARLDKLGPITGPPPTVYCPDCGHPEHLSFQDGCPQCGCGKPAEAE